MGRTDPSMATRWPMRPQPARVLGAAASPKLRSARPHQHSDRASACAACVLAHAWPTRCVAAVMSRAGISDRSSDTPRILRSSLTSPYPFAHPPNATHTIPPTPALPLFCPFDLTAFPTVHYTANHVPARRRLSYDHPHLSYGHLHLSYDRLRLLDHLHPDHQRLPASPNRHTHQDHWPAWTFYATRIPPSPPDINSLQHYVESPPTEERRAYHRTSSGVAPQPSPTTRTPFSFITTFASQVCTSSCCSKPEASVRRSL